MTDIHTDVAVLGDGLSAVATTIGLLKRLPPSTTVTMVGPDCGEGGGAAYATDSSDHLLNVPAGRMSLDPDRQDDFVRWLVDTAPGHGPEDYVPRGLYRAYIGTRLREAVRRSDNTASFRAHPAMAEAFEPSTDGHRIRLSTGEKMEARTVVLCLGAAPAPFPVQDSAVDPDARGAIVPTAWMPWLDRLDPDARVVLIGTGLTMVDQVLSLARRRHRGPITAVSRRGLLPRPHVVPRGHPLDMSCAVQCAGLPALFAEVTTAARSAADWRTVIDGLRPLTHDLWAGLGDADRRRFLRHVLPWWTVHRHRMAPSAAAIVDDMLRSGALAVRAGRPSRVRAADDGSALVEIRTRDAGDVSIGADVVVNCTGTERCPSTVSSPLVRSLVDLGLARPDPHGLGLSCDEASVLLDCDGRPVPTLRAVGPLTSGRFWEITAVPDIRVQAAAVAEDVARSFLN